MAAQSLWSGLDAGGADGTETSANTLLFAYAPVGNFITRAEADSVAFQFSISLGIASRSIALGTLAGLQAWRG